MSALLELGQAIRTRRTEMGLTQAHVALMSGLSRQTINQLETGAAPDLGLNKAERLASSLGLSLHVDTNRAAPLRQRMSPLARAAATANVSYKRLIKPAQLEKILESGKLPAQYIPHLSVLLDEAPVTLLASVAEQIHTEGKVSTRSSVWTAYRKLANQVMSKRDLWSMT